MVGAGGGQAAGDHVGVTDGLDLLQLVPLGQHVEARKDAVEQGHDLFRRQLVRERCESHDVGEQDGHALEAVGDDAWRGLEPLGDRTRQDVQEQPLGLLLLRLERRVLTRELREDALARPHEVLKQEVHGRGYAQHVHDEERHDDRVGNPRPRQLRVNGAGDGHERDEAPKPGQSFANSVEHQRAERGRHRPERDGAGRLESAQAPLQQEGQHQHHAQLACAEEAISLRAGEERDAPGRHHLVDERDQRGQPQP